MPLLPNARAFIIPTFPRNHLPSDIKRWRWSAHFELPFPSPADPAIEYQISAGSDRIICGIYNDLVALVFAVEEAPPNRIILKASTTAAEREKAFRAVDANSRLIATCAPPCMALFITLTEYECPDDACRDAEKRFDQCLLSLNNVIRSIQARIPREIAWSFQPLTMFDIGVAYHCADYFCTDCSPPVWHPLFTAPIISFPRQLAKPLYSLHINQVDIAHIATEGCSVGLENELLVAAITALFEGHPRLTILNAMLAVEILANEYFQSVATAYKINAGVTPERAAKDVEKERRKHRTDLTHLLHVGPQQYHARSLSGENESLYNKLMDAHQVRNNVAHRGVEPPGPEVQRILHTTCDAVTWLQVKLGKPTTELACHPTQLAFRAPG